MATIDDEPTNRQPLSTVLGYRGLRCLKPATASGKKPPEKDTGLGLLICKMIVEAYGGQIWAES